MKYIYHLFFKKRILKNLFILGITLLLNVSAMSQQLSTFYNENNKVGVKDSSGKIIAEDKYDNVIVYLNYLVVIIDNKYGMLNNEGKEIVPLIYDYIQVYPSMRFDGQINNSEKKYFYLFTLKKEALLLEYEYVDGYSFDGMTMVKSNSLFGFIDSTGKEVIPLKYESAERFSEGLSLVSQNGKQSFIDKSGKEIIPLNYYSASSFREGLVKVSRYDEKKSQYVYGFIDKKGREVVPPVKYAEAGYFDEGVALVFDGYYSGLINKQGKEILSPKYREVSKIASSNLYRFFDTGVNKFGIVNSNGKTIVPATKYDHIDDYLLTNKRILVRAKEKIGMIDENGKEIIPPIFDQITSVEGTKVKVKMNDKFGILDSENGKEIIPCRYENDLLFTTSNILVKQNQKWGYIDTMSRELVPIKYDTIEESRSENLKKITLNRKQGILSLSKRKEIIKPEFDSLVIVYEYYNDRTVYIGIMNKKHGLLDTTGKEIVPFNYELIRTDFLAKRNQKYGLLDELSGNEIIPCEYDNIERKRNNFIVKQNGKFGVLEKILKYKEDSTETFYSSYKRIPIDYKDLRSIPNSEHLFIAKLNNQWGLIEHSNEIIIPFKYDSIVPSDSIFFVKKKDNWGILDFFGAKILPLEYEKIEIECRNSCKYYAYKKGNVYVYSADFKELSRHKNYNGLNIHYIEDHIEKYLAVIHEGGSVRVSKSPRIDSLEIKLVQYDEDGNEYVIQKNQAQEYGLKQFIGGKFGFADSLGNPISNARYDSLYLKFVDAYPSDKYHPLGIQEFRCINDPISTKEISENPETYEARGYEYILVKTVLAKRNNKWGAIDWEQKELLPFKWENLKKIGSCFFAFSNHEECLVYNADSNKIVFYGKMDSVFYNNERRYYKIQDRYFKSNQHEKLRKEDLIDISDRIATYYPRETTDFDETGEWFAYEFKNQFDRNADLPKFKEAERRDNFYLVKTKENKYRMVDTLGKFISELEYDEVFSASDGFSIVQSKNKYGFIDENGKESIPCIYDHAESFMENQALVQLGDVAFYIDKTGKSPQTNHKPKNKELEKYEIIIEDFNETGYLRVRQNGKWGIADTSGKEIIPCKYDRTSDFKRDPYRNTNFIKVKLDNKWGLLDTTGKEITTCKYDTIEGDYFLYDFMKVKRDNKWGYINQSGMEIPQKFDKIKDFNHKGWAEVNLNNKWGLLSNQGFEFFPVNFYDEVIDYEKGFAKVSLNGKWGIVNSSGREIIPCKYDEIQNFEKDGFAQLSSNHKWAFVNNSGKIITPFKYDIANMRGHYGGGYEFHQGLAAVNVGGKFQTFDADYSWNGGKWGFIDTTGKEVIPCQYDNVSQDANGNYDSAPAFSADGLVRLKIKGKCGCVDATGKEIIPFKYDSIGIFENGKAKVYQNGKEFYIDKSGNLVK